MRPMPAAPTPRAAPWGLCAVFAAVGLVFASWSSRLPRVERLTHAGNGSLGVALLGMAAGALIAVPLARRACRSRPPRAVAHFALALLCGAVLLPGLARSTVALLICLVVFGAAYGAVDVAMNASAVQLAALLRRPAVPSFHAAFSLGAFAGAGGGALAVSAGVSVESHMAFVAVVTGITLLAAALTSPPLSRPADIPDAGEGGAAPRGPAGGSSVRPLVAVACVLTFGSAFCEGTVAGWSGIHLRQETAASAAVAPLALAWFSLAEAVGRTMGTRLTERLGPRLLARSGGLLAACGFMAALISSLPVMTAGYLVAGLGVSCLFLLGIAQAGSATGSTGVSTASMVGYAGFFLGPPLVGLLAQGTSLPLALTVPVALGLTVFSAAPRLSRGFQGAVAQSAGQAEETNTGI
jgi:MFS family permease